LRIQKERREKKEKGTKVETKNKRDDDINIQEQRTPFKKQKTAIYSATTTTTKTNTGTDDHEYHSNEPLEDFEEGATEWVSKKEAMTVYCLPEGSMAVCYYEERKNPRNPLFKPMKLYRRSEIRYRAHKRHGGVEGLVEERNKRRKRKLDRDMEEARDIFK